MGTGYLAAMEEIRNPLEAIEGDRALLSRCLDSLESTGVAVERADLARATALLAARYENVLADTLYPQITDSLGTQKVVEQAEHLLAQSRETIARVRADVRGMPPIDAHLSDPEGLEADIDAMTAALRSLLDYESSELFELVERLSSEDRVKLREGVEEAAAHQTSLPDPPENSLIRKLAEARETVGLALNDHSTTWHPGVEAVLDGPE
jgi:hypothetical protein